MELFSNPKLHLDKEIICRTPVFALDDQATEKFEALKRFIKEASPSFYQLISGLKKEDLCHMSEKTSFTLWKYFNRAKYRATPFGRFSGISVVPVSQDKGAIILADNFKAHCYTDWQSNEASQYDTNEILARSSWFITNTTLYKVGNEYRYITFDKNRFEMAKVSAFPELDFVIDYCLKKKSKEEILKQLATVMNLSRSSVKQLVTSLISEQLLLSDIAPNITGEDFFQRRQIAPSTENIPPYIIAERKLIDGGYNNNVQRILPDLISFLNIHLPLKVNPNLEIFKRGFKKKFEMKFVPLSMAIDPEVGIGYANLEDARVNKEPADLSDLFKNRNQTEEKQIQYNPLLIFLLNKSNENIIHLEEFVGKQIKTEISLPNTFNVIIHQWNNSGVVEHIGGCTANALLGRFTISCPAVEDMGRRLAAIEQQANPGVLFFDIAYQAERHIDNVNRRKTLYEHELPILTWSCLAEPLCLDDILVGLRDSEVILFSKKHGKRMIPRVPSAYNYNRSDLPLFRFLCDMQHQGIRTDLNFKLNDFLPHMEHYARVMYKSLIIFPETWQVPVALTKNLSNRSIDGKLVLTGWLKEKGISAPFKIGHADQTLVIDPYNAEDIEAFTIYCRKNILHPIYLSEALINNDKMVINQSAKPLAAQMILNYYHQQTIYKAVSNSQHGIDSSSVQHIIPPGRDWLYFEIYCHSSRSDELLVKRIAVYLRMNRKQIKKWFFIRFTEGGTHLRLRLQLKHSSQTIYLIERLQQALDTDLGSGLVADIQIKSYFREIARYGKDRINHVEDFFWYDSLYVINHLKRNTGSNTGYQMVLTTMYRLIALSFPDISKQIDFVSLLATTYSKELSMMPDDYKKLNRQFRALNLSAANFFNPIDSTLRLESQFKKLITLYPIDKDRYTLTADILHMHINRLFYSDQRVHETILYQYLFQLLKSRDFLRIKEGVQASL